MLYLVVHADNGGKGVVSFKIWSNLLHVASSSSRGYSKEILSMKCQLHRLLTSQWSVS